MFNDPTAYLFESDKRFALFAQEQFIHYDLEEPENFPEDLLEAFDIAIVDPPFLNYVSHRILITLHCFR